MLNEDGEVIVKEKLAESLEQLSSYFVSALLLYSETAKLTEAEQAIVFDQVISELTDLKQELS